MDLARTSCRRSPTAGFRAVAPDLRGYGASDKPPRGYDLPTLAADVAALVRALGERDAVVVGHDWGGLLGWTIGRAAPAQRAAAGRRSSMAHPRRLRGGADRPAAAPRRFRYALRFQLPRLPERQLTRADDDPVAELMQRWSGPDWVHTADFAEAVARYRSAARIPQAAYGAMEYYRWAGRSQLRPDGLRYARRMAAPVTAPTLQLHGDAGPVHAAGDRAGLGPLRRRRLRVAAAARRRPLPPRRRPPTLVTGD